jgi:hypothetical protein
VAEEAERKFRGWLPSYSFIPVKVIVK